MTSTRNRARAGARFASAALALTLLGATPTLMGNVANASEAPSVVHAAKKKVHVVKPGETLYGIAQQYGVTVEDLLIWNAMVVKDPSQIQVGQKIYVLKPMKAKRAKTYTVVPGDSYPAIAKKFGLTVEQLRMFNGQAAPDTLTVGTKLSIPPKGWGKKRPKITKYTVVAGDTFYNIGQRYGVDAGTLMAHNGYADPTTLRVGSTIEIPNASKRPKPAKITKYTVVPGDTFSGIGQRYGVDVGTLMAHNEYTDPTTLRVGATIEIPNPTKTPPKQDRPSSYTTKKGDTWASVAKKFGLTEEQLRMFNGMRSPDKLTPGYKVAIPTS